MIIYLEDFISIPQPLLVIDTLLRNIINNNTFYRRTDRLTGLPEYDSKNKSKNKIKEWTGYGNNYFIKRFWRIENFAIGSLRFIIGLQLRKSDITAKRQPANNKIYTFARWR